MWKLILSMLMQGMTSKQNQNKQATGGQATRKVATGVLGDYLNRGSATASQPAATGGQDGNYWKEILKYLQ